MPGNQQRASRHDDECMAKEFRHDRIVQPQVLHGPDHDPEQHGVDDEIREACCAADKDLVEHRASDLFAGEQVGLADNTRPPVATLFSFFPVERRQG